MGKEKFGVSGEKIIGKYPTVQCTKTKFRQTSSTAAISWNWRLFLTAMLVGAVLQTALLDFSLRFSQIGSDLDQIGSDWIRLGQIRSNWIRLDQIGSDWIRLDQIGSDWIRLDQFGSDWIILDQIGSNWIRLDQIGSDWIRLDQIGSD